MYYYISGEVVLKNESFAVIDANGVGYKIYASKKTLESIETEKKEKLYTYLNFKTGAGNDVFDLYGFKTLEEQTLFEMLIGVSRVGAKTALNLLSNISPSKFALCVACNDAKYLAANTPGLGIKGAQRLILELKDKFKGAELDGLAPDEIFDRNGSVENEAVSALMVLGYTKGEAERAIKGIEGSTEEIIKQGLKNLMKG